MSAKGRAEQFNRQRHRPWRRPREVRQLSGDRSRSASAELVGGIIRN